MNKKQKIIMESKVCLNQILQPKRNDRIEIPNYKLNYKNHKYYIFRTFICMNCLLLVYRIFLSLGSYFIVEFTMYNIRIFLLLLNIIIICCVLSFFFSFTLTHPIYTTHLHYTVMHLRYTDLQIQTHSFKYFNLFSVRHSIFNSKNHLP